MFGFPTAIEFPWHWGKDVKRPPTALRLYLPEQLMHLHCMDNAKLI